MCHSPSPLESHPSANHIEYASPDAVTWLHTERVTVMSPVIGSVVVVVVVFVVCVKMPVAALHTATSSWHAPKKVNITLLHDVGGAAVCGAA